MNDGNVSAGGQDSDEGSLRSPVNAIRNHQAQPHDKENVPPIEEKENIPPVKAQPSHQKKQYNLLDPCCSKQLDASANESNTSILPVDLQKGVDLINVLVDSRQMSQNTKKKCIRKIVSRLLRSEPDNLHDLSQMLASCSLKSKSTKDDSDRTIDSSDTSVIVKNAKPQMSGVSALSSSANSTASSMLRHKSNEQSADLHETTTEKDWLKPITQSEMDKELSRRSQNDSRLKDEHQQTSRVNSNSRIFEFLKHEKATHFNWVDQEIRHLKNLKMLLESMQVNNSTKDDSLRAVYENFRRNKNEVSGDGSQGDVSSAIQGEASDSTFPVVTDLTYQISFYP